MNRFLLRVLSFTAFLFIALVGVVIYLVWLCKDNHIYIDAYGQKEQLLAETTSPRIIFQGGSNVAFGIDSKAVEDSVGLRTVNLGLNMGLGLRMMLSEVAEYCRKGDILVLSPEYEHFYGDAYGSSETLSSLTLLYPKIAKYFNYNQAFVAAKGLPEAFIIMNNIFKGYITGAEDKAYPYSALNFNAYGDEERHWSHPKDRVVFYELDIPDEFDEEYFEEFCSELDELEARGIGVIMIPPSMYSKIYDKEEEKIRYVEERLKQAGYPFAYDQELSVYEREDMFDSSYHLTKPGIDKRMRLIIDVLRSHMGTR